MTDFEASTTSSPLSPVDSLDMSSGLTRTDDLVMLVERIAAAIRPATEHEAHWEQLEKAVAHEWLRGLSIIRTGSNAKLLVMGVPIEPSENQKPQTLENS